MATSYTILSYHARRPARTIAGWSADRDDSELQEGADRLELPPPPW
jgi:hypothetical protein